MSEKKELSQKDRKQLAKQRKTAAKQAQKYHKEQEKKVKKSSAATQKRSTSKIEEALNLRKNKRYENISREEKFRRESNEKIRNLEPRDFDDGYYIDEYGAKQKQERRAKEIHDQENEVLRRRKNPITPKQLRLRRILIYSGIFVAVLIIGITLSLTVLFKTEKIIVEGDKYYYEEQIIAFSDIELQKNIFTEVFSSTPERISENLPYVEKADISFSVPDTVTIKVTNAVPSYVIKNGDKYLLISSKGRILDSVDSNGDKLPELKCDKLKSTKPGDYVSFSDESVPNILDDVSKSLRDNNVKDITGFDVTDTANVVFEYDKRIKINIGLPEDIDYKIRTAMTIIKEKLDPGNTRKVSGTLDVSSCNTTKISRYKPAATTAPATSAPTTAPPADDYYSDTYDNGYVWDGGSYSDDIYGEYGDVGEDNGDAADTDSDFQDYDGNTDSEDGYYAEGEPDGDVYYGE